MRSSVLLLAAASIVPACAAGTSPASANSPDGGVHDDAGVAPGSSVGTNGTFDPGLMPTTAQAWRQLAPRPASAAATSVDTGPSGYVLDVGAGAADDVYGGWTTHIGGLQSGAWYRFVARAQTHGITSITESVTIILRWRGSFGDEVSPDYVWDFARQSDGSVVYDRTIQAPSGTNALDVELVLQWAPLARVAFDRLSFTPVAPPAARPVRIAAIRYRPAGTANGLDSVQQAAQYATQVAATQHPDVMVFGELLNVIGSPGTLDSHAESVPGPSTEVMAALARAQHVNVAFGMVERAGDTLYNTAVLLDRSGNLVGKYHKVQLPLSDAASGITPGDAVPVFDIDVGRVALLICQDSSFPEPAREAALQGAEILLLPIWGGKTALVHARAIENGIHVAASGYDYASEVVDPLGNVLATVDPNSGPGAAIADIDLAQRHREQWLGDWRDIAVKERRTKPYHYQLP